MLTGAPLTKKNEHDVALIGFAELVGATVEIGDGILSTPSIVGEVKRSENASPRTNKRQA